MSRAGDLALATLELDASRVQEVALGGDAFDVVSAELGKRGMWLSDVRAFESGSVAKRSSLAEEGDDEDEGDAIAWSSLSSTKFARCPTAMLPNFSLIPINIDGVALAI